MKRLWTLCSETAVLIGNGTFSQLLRRMEGISDVV
jgi:hypothetical protein